MADCTDECSLRSFPNQWFNDSSCKLKMKPNTQQDNLHMLLAEIRPRLTSEINKCLVNIEEYYSNHTSDQSVYTGLSGLSLFYLNMAIQLHSNDQPKMHQLLLKSLSFIRPCLSSLDVHRHTFLCGAPGPLAIASVLYTYLDKKVEAMNCIDQLVAIYTRQRDEFRSGKIPSELLYGCTGYLYSLLFVNNYITNGISRDIIEEVEEILISQGQRGHSMTTPSPLMYTWHSKHYLGAAHGLAGILTVLLQDASESSIVTRNLGDIQGTVDYLLSLQLPSKNFPSSIESVNKDRLVQWCHGAPGFVYLWSQAYKVFGKPDYLRAARDCGEVVWEKGLLRKGYSLCHGTAGNGYTFLQLYQLTGDQCYLHRALKYVDWCISSDSDQCPQPDRPFSLFEGLLSRMYFYLELCVDPQQARFPALELPFVQSKLNIK